MISIMLVDDQPAILKGLEKVVNSTGIACVVATETNGPDALASAAKYRPDMIMLDVSMPEMNGIDVAKELVGKYENVRILAISAHGSSIYVRGMLNAGANGYMLKDNASAEMKNAIQTIMKGAKWLGRGVSVIAG